MKRSSNVVSQIFRERAMESTRLAEADLLQLARQIEAEQPGFASVIRHAADVIAKQREAVGEYGKQ